MNLAIRVRDYRYAKGWGPDELANRAEISRTALYQIESGKTELPRAGTLRRIAIALEVSMEDLLGTSGATTGPAVVSEKKRGKNRLQWLPGEGGPLLVPSEASHGVSPSFTSTNGDEHRFVVKNGRAHTPFSESVFLREGELMSKLHDLLHSSLGEGVARILEDLHAIVPKTRSTL